MILKLKENVFFRRMKLEDVPEVQEIDAQSFTSPWPSGAFEYELKGANRSICMVAESFGEDQKSRIIGYIVVWIIIDEAHIGTIAVLESFRHRGVGKELLARALLNAKKVGAVKALLEVRESNIRSQHLYYGFGFETVGIRPCYYNDTHEDALLMTLNSIDSVQLTNILTKADT